MLMTFSRRIRSVAEAIYFLIYAFNLVTPFRLRLMCDSSYTSVSVQILAIAADNRISIYTINLHGFHVCIFQNIFKKLRKDTWINRDRISF